MKELLSWVKPYYTPGERDHFIFYLSGMMRKNGGYPLDNARTFIKLLCNSSGYNDEDLEKSLTVVDRTYRKPLDELNGKAGLHDLLVTSYEIANRGEYLDRAEAFSQICQIIDGPSSPPNYHDGADGRDGDGKAGFGGDNNNPPGEPGSWLAGKLALDKNLDITDTLVKEVMKRDIYKTFIDTKEILWARGGVFRYGGEDRINIMLEEFAGPEITITKRREIIERIRIKTLKDRNEFDKNPLLRNVKNGIVCLECGKRFPHDPERYPSLIQIPHEYYTPEEMKERIAARPKGRQFLGKKIVFEFLCNVMDAPDVRLAIDFWGYCLIGDNRFQKSLMDTGPPDSGKSLHLDITRA